MPRQPEYREPVEQLTKHGYASSVLNGTTVEGGLRSITYKSIYALQLVENLDRVRRVMAPLTLEVLLLRDTALGEDQIPVLRAEVDALRARVPVRDIATDVLVADLNEQLDRELTNGKTIGPEYQARVMAACGDVAPDNSILFKKFISNEPVATMEAVEGFDGTMYHQAAERRREEERFENERFALEAKRLEEEAMMEEMKIRQQEQWLQKLQEQSGAHGGNGVSGGRFAGGPQARNGASPMDLDTPVSAPPYTGDLSLKEQSYLRTSSYGDSSISLPGN